MPDANSVPPKVSLNPDKGDITVGELISYLQAFNEGYLVGLQIGDQVTSPVLRLSEIEADPLWGIVDLVMEERVIDGPET